jgi:hypothetical protein
MTQRFPSPISDYAFALLFGDQRHIEILTAFLKSVLYLPEDGYRRLTIVNPFLKRPRTPAPQRQAGHRGRESPHQVRQDNPCRNPGEPLLLDAEPDRLLHRKTLMDQLRSGGSYEKIHQVISIVICD